VSLSVVGLVTAYGLVMMLLLSLNLTSLWRWWIKAGAIVVTTAFFGVSYLAITGLMGWPTTQKLPSRFNMVSSVIVEPDRRTNNPGSIYLWASEIDQNNVPASVPRSYRIAYSSGLARKISGAQEKHDSGQEVMGVISDREQEKEAERRTDIKNGRIQDNGQQAPATDTTTIREDGDDISFQDLPPVLLPDKEALTE
jgi:hypothetical protein